MATNKMTISQEAQAFECFGVLLENDDFVCF